MKTSTLEQAAQEAKPFLKRNLAKNIQVYMYTLYRERSPSVHMQYHVDTQLGSDIKVVWDKLHLQRLLGSRQNFAGTIT